MHKKSDWIRVFRGDLSQYHACMERFELQHRGVWRSSANEKLEFGFDPELQSETRKVWFVRSIEVVKEKQNITGKWATVYAFLDEKKYTTVEFIDGLHEYIPRWYSVRGVFDSGIIKREVTTPIGKAFKKFIQTLTKDWIFDKDNTEFSEEAKQLLPEREFYLLRWKQAWAIITGVENEYKELYEYGDTDKPSTSIDDLRDALGYEMNWKPSERTVRKIRKAGRLGLLDN